MTEPVVIALVSAAGLVLVALIGLIGRVSFQITRVRRDTAITREQVANDHYDETGEPINLRVEQDDRHTENTQRLEALAERFDHGFATIIAEIHALWGKAGSNADRIKLLEQTAPPPFSPPASGRHRKETP